MKKFEVGDEVQLSRSSEYWNANDQHEHPMNTSGKIIELVDVQGRLPYIVEWETGQVNQYGTVDLKPYSEGLVSKERAERVVPFKVVTGGKNENTPSEESEEEKTREYIRTFMEDYKDYFDDIVIVGSTDDKGMELMHAGLTPPEVYFVLQAAAHQLMQQIMFDSEMEGEYE